MGAFRWVGTIINVVGTVVSAVGEATGNEAIQNIGNTISNIGIGISNIGQPQGQGGGGSPSSDNGSGDANQPSGTPNAIQAGENNTQEAEPPPEFTGDDPEVAKGYGFFDSIRGLHQTMQVGWDWFRENDWQQVNETYADLLPFSEGNPEAQALALYIATHGIPDNTHPAEFLTRFAFSDWNQENSIVALRLAHEAWKLLDERYATSSIGLGFDGAYEGWDGNPETLNHWLNSDRAQVNDAEQERNHYINVLNTAQALYGGIDMQLPYLDNLSNQELRELLYGTDSTQNELYSRVWHRDISWALGDPVVASQLYDLFWTLSPEERLYFLNSTSTALKDMEAGSLDPYQNLTDVTSDDLDLSFLEEAALLTPNGVSSDELQLLFGETINHMQNTLTHLGSDELADLLFDIRYINAHYFDEGVENVFDGLEGFFGISPLGVPARANDKFIQNGFDVPNNSSNAENISPAYVFVRDPKTGLFRPPRHPNEESSGVTTLYTSIGFPFQDIDAATEALVEQDIIRANTLAELAQRGTTVDLSVVNATTSSARDSAIAFLNQAGTSVFYRGQRIETPVIWSPLSQNTDPITSIHLYNATQISQLPRSDLAYLSGSGMFEIVPEDLAINQRHLLDISPMLGEIGIPLTLNPSVAANFSGPNGVIYVVRYPNQASTHGSLVVPPVAVPNLPSANILNPLDISHQMVEEEYTAFNFIPSIFVIDTISLEDINPLMATPSGTLVVPGK